MVAVELVGDVIVVVDVVMTAVVESVDLHIYSGYSKHPGPIVLRSDPINHTWPSMICANKTNHMLFIYYVI